MPTGISRSARGSKSIASRTRCGRRGRRACWSRRPGSRSKGAELSSGGADGRRPARPPAETQGSSRRAGPAPEHRPFGREPNDGRGFPVEPQRAVLHVLVPQQIDGPRSEEHTSELQSRLHLVCRLLLEKKKNIQRTTSVHV